MSTLVIGGSGYIGSAIIKHLQNEKIEHTATYCNNQKPETNIKFDILNDKDIENISLGSNSISSLIICYQVVEKEVLQLYQQKKEIPYELESKHLDSFNKRLVLFLKKIEPCLQEGANIIYLGALSDVKSVQVPLAYSMAKSAQTSLLKSLTKNWGDRRIKINSIIPGVLEGGISNYLCDDLKNVYLKHCALKRYGTADEVAQLAVWLILNNTYITGQQFILDGGL